MAGTQKSSAPPSWTFITTHGLVLLAIAENPEIRLRDIAVQVGITERAVQRIVADLTDTGYLSKSRRGRRNLYRLHPDQHLRHSTTRHQEVGALMTTLLSRPAEKND